MGFYIMAIFNSIQFINYEILSTKSRPFSPDPFCSIRLSLCTCKKICIHHLVLMNLCRFDCIHNTSLKSKHRGKSKYSAYPGAGRGQHKKRNQRGHGGGAAEQQLWVSKSSSCLTRIHYYGSTRTGNVFCLCW